MTRVQTSQRGFQSVKFEYLRLCPPAFTRLQRCKRARAALWGTNFCMAQNAVSGLPSATTRTTEPLRVLFSSSSLQTRVALHKTPPDPKHKSTAVPRSVPHINTTAKPLSPTSLSASRSACPSTPREPAVYQMAPHQVNAVDLNLSYVNSGKISMSKV